MLRAFTLQTHQRLKVIKAKMAYLNFLVGRGRSDCVEKALAVLAAVTAETSLVLDKLLSEDLMLMLSGLCLRRCEECWKGLVMSWPGDPM